ncbi:hypothetical protein K4A83_22320 [Spirulina subsalsa FACHB-351]|uniref:LapA family protein n=1 Tax=Spirulina subsalsa FACHB-351 TaxID=234711 RepID=A0ABT3LBU4_9CYAN|nr:hypothetical protein [Spirulina subsalsa]MCW6038966.1 hypothetical protein [Spirulina subsalsa FACHB-351]
MMQIFVLLLLVLALTLLVAQNWVPLLPLVLFGATTVSLPVAIWLVLAIASGILTSILLQILNYRPVSGSSRPRTPPQPAPRYRESENPSEGAKTRLQDSNGWDRPLSEDWDAPGEEEWDIEEPPRERTIPRPRPREDYRDSPRSYEVPQPPPQTQKEGTVYRQQYGERTPQPTPEESARQTDNIYEADYRVITPPFRPDSSPEEEEDWV